jgi:hypothetical protein
MEKLGDDFIFVRGKPIIGGNPVPVSKLLKSLGYPLSLVALPMRHEFSDVAFLCAQICFEHTATDGNRQDFFKFSHPTKNIPISVGAAEAHIFNEIPHYTVAHGLLLDVFDEYGMILQHPTTHKYYCDMSPQEQAESMWEIMNDPDEYAKIKKVLTQKATDKNIAPIGQSDYRQALDEAAVFMDYHPFPNGLGESKFYDTHDFWVKLTASLEPLIGVDPSNHKVGVFDYVCPYVTYDPDTGYMVIPTDPLNINSGVPTRTVSINMLEYYALLNWMFNTFHGNPTLALEVLTNNGNPIPEKMNHLWW